MSDQDRIVPFPDLQRIKEEAAMWVARCEARPLSAADRQEFAQWLKRSQVHTDEFQRLSAYWSEFDILDELNFLGDGEADAEPPGPHRKVRRAVIAALAASIAAIVGIGAYLTTGPAKLPSQTEELRTALGEQDAVALVDGSTVTLNTNSLIQVDFSQSGRDIRLLQGEAHFDVAHEASRPFSVHAGDGIVRAVGTAFSVQLLDNRVEVTVAEGTVALITKDQTTAPAGSKSAKADRNESAVDIGAGDYAIIGENNIEHIAPMTDVELNRKLSWRRGLLSFAGEPLSEVLTEVSRYTEFKIEVDDPAIGALPIGGYFKVGEVEGLLSALEGTFDIQVEYLEDDRVRLSQASTG